jgi:phage RecT family recombinase
MTKETAIQLKVKTFLDSFKSKEVYNYAITLSPIFKDPESYIDYRKQVAQLLIAVPKLTEYDPKSLIYATAKAYEQGYSFDPKDAEAYFIPYGKEIQFQKGYRGVMKDLMKRPDVIDITADVVYEDDDFEVNKDPHGRLILVKHRTNPFKKSKDKIIGAYAFVYYKVDGKVVSNGVVMSSEEIEEEFRSLSKADKSMGKNSFWEKWKADMYKKTAIKQLRKILPPLPEEKMNAYKELSTEDDMGILDRPPETEERKDLIKAFNEAYTKSGLTAKELQVLLTAKFQKAEPADLTNEELIEITEILKAQGRAVLNKIVLINEKQQAEIDNLLKSKQLREKEIDHLFAYLGMDRSAIPTQEEFQILKQFLLANDREQILKTINWEEGRQKKAEQVPLEEALDNV